MAAASLPRTRVIMALPVESDGVFEAAQVPVLYCGIGKVNAAIMLTRELARYAAAGEPMPLILNFGSCGSRCHPHDTLLACHEFVQRDMDVRGLGFELGVTPYDPVPARLSFEPLFPQLPAAVCGSGDSFALEASALECEVLDMEAYALAKTCVLLGAGFGSAKYVTDGADGASPEDWHANVHRAAERFLSLYRGLQA